MARSSMVFLCIFLLFSVCLAEERPLPDTTKFRESYSLGYEFGASVVRQNMDMDMDVLLSAARDALEGRKPSLTPAEIQEALKDLRRKVTVAQELRNKDRAARNLEKGRSFLDDNKTKDGIKTLPSGLQYMVLHEGTGPVPNENDMVKVHYRGMFIDGTEFDSSYSHGGPLITHADGMMPGWTEALKLMKVGSKWKIFIPAELAYAERQFGRIPPNSALIYEIELKDAGEDLLPRTIGEYNEGDPAADHADDAESHVQSGSSGAGGIKK